MPYPEPEGIRERLFYGVAAALLMLLFAMVSTIPLAQWIAGHLGVSKTIASVVGYAAIWPLGAWYDRRQRVRKAERLQP